MKIVCVCVRARNQGTLKTVCVCHREMRKGGQRTSSLVPWPMEEKEISELQRLGVRVMGPEGLSFLKLPFS